jgi:NADPH-dependent 2,4-dienoyl-CoA reductase/sulfur reductase-like enzyme
MRESASAFEVVVVGAGPAGIAASCAAAEAGRRVAVLEATPWVGGQIWRERGTKAASAHAERWFARLRASGVELIRGAAVVAAPRPRRLLAERADGVLEIEWQKLILAVGARELFLPFPGWTLPNVFGPGGLEKLVASGWPIAGKNVVVAGSGPLVLAAAADLRAAGANVLAVAEQANWRKLLRFGLGLPLLAPGKLIEGARYRARLLGVPYRAGWWPTEAFGRDRIESVTLSNGTKTQAVPCDVLACGFGIVPNTELPEILGCRLERGLVSVDARQETSVADVYCAGEPTGIGGVDAALLEGEIAGHAAAGRTERAERLFAARDRTRRFAAALGRAFALRGELKRLARSDTLVCRCEDVARGELDSYGDWRTAKLHTRCGMGPCQGRICGSALRAILGWEPDSVRPPVVPARVETLATLDA